MRTIGALAILVVAHLLDLLTTFIGLARGIPEGNPVFHGLVASGWPIFATVKASIVILLIFLLTRDRWSWPLWVIGTVPVCIVVVNNVALILT